MRTGATYVSVLGLLFGSIVPTTALAQKDVSESEKLEQLDEETAVAVSSLLSRVKSLSVDEAIRRIQLEAAVAASIQDIRREYAGRLTDISIEHSPDFHVSVKLKGDGAVAERQWATAAGKARVEFSPGHPFTEEEFTRRLKEIRLAAQSAIPGFVGLTGYAGDNEAELRIRADEQDVQKYMGILSKLDRAYGVNLRFKTSDVP